MRVVNTDQAPAALGPYVQGLIAGDFLYVSGQLPIDPLTAQKVGETSIKDQTRQTLSNLKAIIENAGASLHDVVRCTVFIKNMDDFAAMNEVYSEFFNTWKPTRSAVEVSRLAKGVLIEIDAIVYLGKKDGTSNNK